MSNDGTSATQAVRALVKDTNINEETLLATDYLNHFNEVIMLIGQIPEIPECLDEARNWRPRSYVEHFRASAFSHRDLAVLAYENAPAVYRQPFDATTRQIRVRLEDGLAEIEALCKTENTDQLRHTVEIWSRDIRLLVDRASAIINGDFGKDEANAAVTLDQVDIDALFDRAPKPAG